MSAFGARLTRTGRRPVVYDSPLPAFRLGDALEVYVRREDAERFIEGVRSDEPELAKGMRIEERELETRN